MKSDALSRIRVLSVLIFLFAALVVLKLFFVQIVHGGEYAEAADRQYVTPAARVFERGSIFFRERSGELASAATLQSGFILAVNPKQVADPEALYRRLREIIPLDHDGFVEKISKKNDPYEEVARRLSKEEADKINALKEKSLSPSKEKWRFYPGGDLAARVIGLVGYNTGDQLAGRYGLERYYEDILSRRDNNLYVNFFAEVFSNLGDSLLNGQGREGDIILTVEPEVAKALYDELASIMSKWQPDQAGGVIINPQDGSIYAMEVLPSFDLNNFKSVKDPGVFSNPMVENVYEMGSIIKPLVMAAGLDAGVVTSMTTYDDKGFVVLNNAKIKNFDGKARGIVPMQEVLNQSLNTGIVFVMQRLGREKFKNYMLGYGIGQETGIDLPNETHGLVKNLESNRDIEYATASFGQGIAMTPIGTVRALSALGNGGRLIEPHLIETIDYKGGFKRKPEYTNEGKQVISNKASEEITRMLVNVVDKALLGGTVKIPEYSVAAKTGTAQISKEGGKGYYDDRFLHSFFGYFPAYDPKFLVFLYIVNPKNGATLASHTLTQPFIHLTKFLLNYYEIPPDRPIITNN